MFDCLPYIPGEGTSLIILLDLLHLVYTYKCILLWFFPFFMEKLNKDESTGTKSQL